MPIPRILFGVPLLIGGLFLPAVDAEPAVPPAGVIGMSHELFTTETVTIHQGQTVTMANNSRWIHIVGPGRDGRLEEPRDEPMGFRHLMETNDTFTSGKWNKPGTYFVTCSVHPEMNLKVIVTECGCCSNGTC